MIMLFFQIFIGGVTRLTGSGLSITKWEIVTGTIPPLSEKQWLHEFELYKETPQYEKINEGMSMSDFKFIYFWEYFHRLWARTMGFVFLFPFIFFLFKGWLSKRLIRQLVVLVLLTMVVAVFGWIMVASGLVDRPWVNAYKLTWHLSLALIVFGYMSWIVYESWWPGLKGSLNLSRHLVWWLLGLVSLQIMLGGIMSGAKAGLVFPTWPDMNGQLIPSILLSPDKWKWSYFIEYDTNVFFPALIQFLHRSVAYIIFVFVIWLFIRLWKSKRLMDRRSGIALFMFVMIQVILGIFTVINCKGHIPVALGVYASGCCCFCSWHLYLVPVWNQNERRACYGDLTMESVLSILVSLFLWQKKVF